MKQAKALLHPFRRKQPASMRRMSGTQILAVLALGGIKAMLAPP
jgi:hypothetical protein